VCHLEVHYEFLLGKVNTITLIQHTFYYWQNLSLSGPFCIFVFFFFLCQKVANELKIFNHTCFYLYRKHSKCTVHWCKEHNFSFLIINNCSPCLKQFQIYCVLNSCVWQKFDQIIKIFGFITSKTDIEGSNSVTDIHQVHKIINK
jgi:hypothetical protein